MRSLSDSPVSSIIAQKEFGSGADFPNFAAHSFKYSMLRKFTLLLAVLALLIAGCRTTKPPETVFEQEKCPPPPDYADMTNWAAHPDKEDRADLVPGAKSDGINFKNGQANAAVDVFFIHPTIFFDKKEWNADVEDEKLNKQIESTTIRHQASIFNGVGRVYAPRYRQMVYGGFMVDKTQAASAKKAIDLAYADVKNAFEYFLEHENEGRPIVIASHSQGSVHAIRLIREEMEGKPIMDRLVVAYLAGWPVRKDTFAVLPPCTTPDQTGCFASWYSFEAGHEPENPGFYRNAVCVNPITWKMDTVVSQIGDHQGVVMANYKKFYSEKLTAQVHNNVLWVTRPKVPGTFVISDHNFHIADFNLFWGNVRANVGNRVEKYLRSE
jgi:hypothetical protein